MRRAFSLIEVVVAITILSLITTSLFAIIRGAVRGATEIENLQREADQISRFLDLLRKTFTTLPGTATLTLTVTGNSVSDLQELLVAGAPRSFGFGSTPISYSETTLGLRPDLNGATDENGAPIFDLSISREDIIPRSGDDEMALLPGVTQLKWRFYKQDEDAWYEEWEESDWPNLIEVQIVMRDRTTPIRMVCGVPVIELTEGRSSGSGSDSSSGNTTSAAGGAAGGIGPGGRGGPGGGPGGGRGGPGGGRGGPGGGRGGPGGGGPGGGPGGGGPGGGGPGGGGPGGGGPGGGGPGGGGAPQGGGS